MSGSVSANRTTDAWKINLNSSASYRQQHFDLEDEDSFTSIRRSYDGRGLVPGFLH